jgi:hypothetical protein
MGLDLVEFNIVSLFEEEFKCSGICTSALFYYSEPLYNGRPSETCLESIRHTFQGKIGVLLDTTGAISAMSFLIFLMHFSLYGKNTNLPRERHLENNLNITGSP